MKRKHQGLQVTLLLVFLLAGLSACRKDKDPVDDDTLACVDAAHAEAAFGDLINICDEAGYNDSAFTGILSSPCVTVQYDTASATDSIVIDFGSSNCVCNDNSRRRGKIIVKFNGNYSDSAMEHTIDLYNYYLDDVRLSGSGWFVNRGQDSVSGHTIVDAVINGRLTLGTGGQVIWNSAKRIEWTAGESTRLWTDNQYMVTGNASGAQSTGRPFLYQITVPLHRLLTAGCRKNYVSGRVSLLPNEMDYRIIDLGAGGCDNDAIVIIGDNTFPIVLR